MLRFLVFSDSHGRIEPMLDLYKQYPNDGIIHLGDHISDARQLMPMVGAYPVYQVRGNCDPFDHGPEEQILSFHGTRIMICHGHRYQVKSTYQPVYYRGLELGADFVLFGHTHQAMYEEGDVTLINPGSVSSFNLRFDSASWGLLTLSEKKSENFLRKYEKKTCQNI